jgi:hypothetical protein
MSLLQAALEPTLSRGTSHPDPSGADTPYRLSVFIACTVLTLITNFPGR